MLGTDVDMALRFRMVAAVGSIGLCVTAVAAFAATAQVCDCDTLAAAHRAGFELLTSGLFEPAPDQCAGADPSGDGSASAADLIALVSCRSRQLRFTDTTSAAGLFYKHEILPDAGLGILRMICGGVAVGDYDRDGWFDLYTIRHATGSNLLFRNKQDGTFAEVSHDAGVDLAGDGLWSGPSFADIDGDGWLDLFLGAGVSEPMVLRNRGDGSFEDVTASTADSLDPGVYLGAAFGDYDLDGDLDLFAARWGTDDDDIRHDHLWRNDGAFAFTPATLEAGIGVRSTRVGTPDLRFWTQSGNFADINSDGLLDLVVVADFGVSQVFLATAAGTFVENTTDVITDENGMGSAVGDYDNDGDLDWFVSSVFGPRINKTGNRLYRNRGDGSFEDATEEAGVREGFWGWASCFADFDNDGNLDIFHVDGRGGPRDPFFGQPARLFMSTGDGKFSERAEQMGIADRGEGLGASCFDYDNDGDIDVFLTNVGGTAVLYRNDGGNRSHFLQVELRGSPPNTEGIGARIYVEAGGKIQMREIRVSNNYVSQDPAVAHFGMGESQAIDAVRVVWPGGQTTSCGAVEAGHRLRVDQESGACR